MSMNRSHCLLSSLQGENEKLKRGAEVKIITKKGVLFKGILFDFDGTLANTMQNHYDCWKIVFEAIGVSLSEKDYYPMEGASLMDIAKKFSKLREPRELEVLVRNKKDRYIKKSRILLDLS